jgi:hypothetical protein
LNVRISKWPLAAVIVLLVLGVISVLIGFYAWYSDDERGIWVVVFGGALLLGCFAVDRWYRI